MDALMDLLSALQGARVNRPREWNELSNHPSNRNRVCRADWNTKNKWDRDPYVLGWDAFNRGLLLRQNPYSLETIDGILWARGYLARQEALKLKRRQVCKSR